MHRVSAGKFFMVTSLALLGCSVLYVASIYLPLSGSDSSNWPPAPVLASVVLLILSLAVLVPALQILFPDWFPQPEAGTFSDGKISVRFQSSMTDLGILVAAVIVLVCNPGGFAFRQRLPDLSQDFGTVVVVALLLGLLVWRTVLMQRNLVIAPDDWPE